MKTKLFRWTGRCIFLALLIVICTMCKKKESDSATHQRVTGMKYYYNDTLVARAVITYSGNLMTEQMLYDTGNVEQQKIVVSYSGNLITSINNMSKENGAWTNNYLLEISGYSGNKPGVIIDSYQSSSGTLWKYRTQYFWNGDLLTKTVSETSVNGQWQPGGTTNYYYDNSGKILKKADSSSGYLNRATFSYNADLMTEALYEYFSNGTLVFKDRTSYEYVNNRLSKYVAESFETSGWVKSNERQFTYNSNGNLEQEQGASYNNNYYETRTEYTYGSGTGNYSQVTQLSWSGLEWPGNPVPRPVKSTGPVNRIPFADFYEKPRH